MSVFKVKLTQGNQGALDTSLTNSVSAQRSMYVPGPHGTFRKLDDGETFSDVNYYKRYAYPQVSLDNAFLEVLTDDGTTWSDTNPNNNVFTKVHTFTVDANDTYEDNALDILSEWGGPAVFTQLIVSSDEVNCKLNGDSDAIFSLATGTQIFDRGDLVLNEIAFDNSESGATNATVVGIFTIETQAGS